MSSHETLITTHSVETPSGRISYASAGSGPAALFVHGVVLNKHLWRHQLAGLSDIRRCIAVDLLAHGDTEIAPEAANDIPDQPEQKPDPNSEPEAGAKTSVKVDVKTNMLGVFEGDKIIAAYPVTVGSKQTATPIGEWKVRGVAKLPTFRYDERMLKHGERSKNFHILPPGPNNPVGVVWIALNKRGIGIHGTDDPNTIGQAVSHGCIRLANWDVVRLAGRVKTGVPVSVH